jgi:hypothetical protein
MSDWGRRVHNSFIVDTRGQQAVFHKFTHLRRGFHVELFHQSRQWANVKRQGGVQ